jgi:hypothetical protein
MKPVMPTGSGRFGPGTLDNRLSWEEGVWMQRFEEATPMQQDKRPTRAVPKS